MKLVIRCAAVSLGFVAIPVLPQASPPMINAQVNASNWLARGTDVPADPAWRFSTLPNGLRYAVRRSAQPPGMISIRVRIGVGGLMEAESQQGWSHLLEHMVFRGTKRFADGEAIKLWQRLGASFGSDTNASTTLTATTYQLDLPHPDQPGLREAMTVLADMMDAAQIDQGLLSTERKVVDAERAQRLSPLIQKLRKVQQPLFYAGTKAAQRDVIGTAATLAGADAQSLKAYYESWYRPDNAVVVIAGDADPALLEAEVRRAFGRWKPSVPAPVAPDMGSPSQPSLPVAALADPQVPDIVLLNFVTPHVDKAASAARIQERLARAVALGVLNQRLSTAARKGEATLSAGARFSEQRFVQDELSVQVQHKPGQWQQALDQTYRVLNAAAASPPSKREIDQQMVGLSTVYKQLVASATTRSAGSHTSGMLNAVEDAGVVAAPDYSLQLLSAWQATATPGTIHTAMKQMLAPPARMMVMSKEPVAGDIALVEQALRKAQRLAGGAAEELREVSFDDLKLSGKAATASAVTRIPELGADRTVFSNGAELVFKRTAFERDRVRVRVSVGGGLLSEPRGNAGLWWTAGALPGAGIGPFTPEELARATAGRQVGFSAGSTADSLAFFGVTNATDLAAMLKLMTAQIAQPRFDDVTVNRVRDSSLASYQSTFSQPVGVFQALSGAALHGGDERFNSLPSQADIQRLALPAFRKFWTERLAQGPLRITVVGDVDHAVVTAAVAATLGTLEKRAQIAPQAADVIASAPEAPVVLKHQGDPNQAFVLRAFPTLGLFEDPATSEALDLSASILQARLLEGFRATAGGSYSPLVGHPQSPDLPRYGVFIAGAQVQVSRIDEFEKSLNSALADLAAKGPKLDELGRAQTTAVSTAERSREDNGWWLGILSGDLSALRIASVSGRIGRLKAVTSDAIRLASARYLTPATSFIVKVMPTASPPSH